eukprot:1157578-Pelagomonas_calceolata.AAC.8
MGCQFTAGGLLVRRSEPAVRALQAATQRKDPGQSMQKEITREATGSALPFAFLCHPVPSYLWKGAAHVMWILGARHDAQ